MAEIQFPGRGEKWGKFCRGHSGKRKMPRPRSLSARASPGWIRERIGLCGYSFGSIVAFSVAWKIHRVKPWPASLPLSSRKIFLTTTVTPKLLVCGTQDEFVDVKALEQLIQKIPEPKELAIYPGVDHFWVGEEEAMAEKVGEFFVKFLKGEKNNLVRSSRAVTRFA